MATLRRHVLVASFPKTFRVGPRYGKPLTILAQKIPSTGALVVTTSIPLETLVRIA
jgi:hypothetical protein